MPTPIFYRLIAEKSEMFIQIRPYTGCNEALILDLTFTPKEDEDIFTEEFVETIQQRWKSITQEEFRENQNTFLNGESWNYWYKKYYELWHDYYSAKSKSIKIARKTKEFYGYYKVLEDEYKSNNVYSIRENIRKLEEELKTNKQFSLYDIFKEARVNTTHEFITGNI